MRIKEITDFCKCEIQNFCKCDQIEALQKKVNEAKLGIVMFQKLIQEAVRLGRLKEDVAYLDGVVYIVEQQDLQNQWKTVSKFKTLEDAEAEVRKSLEVNPNLRFRISNQKLKTTVIYDSNSDVNLTAVNIQNENYGVEFI